MALIKVLKFYNGIPTEQNQATDDISARSFYVGGPSGTILTKAILDTLSGGSADASGLHNHNTQYFLKTQYLSSSSGSVSGAQPIVTDSRGKFDPSFYQQSDITHGNLSGLTSDDHPQYYNQTRGDARYYPQTTFISTSTGSAQANLPVKTNGQGQIDGSLLGASAGSINHENLSGLLGGATSQHYHLTQTEHDTLTGDGMSGVVDASALHIHDSRYYTKSQVDSSLALKANDNIVIKKDGSVSYIANQSMGGFKLTNLADGTASTDSTAYHQLTDGLALKLNKAGDMMTGNLDMGGNKVQNMAAATVGTDGVNLNVLQNYISGIQFWRPEADLYDNVDTTLPTTTATQIDGVTVTNGIRVLFVNLSSNNNEIYTAAVSGSSITWTAALDDGRTSALPQKGDSLVVAFGSTYSDSAWNYNGVSWVQFNGAGQIQAGSGLAKMGNTLSVVTGAGITFLPTGDVGVNLYTSSGLDLVDPTSGLSSLLVNAQLTVKLADATLTKSASGLAVGIIQTANIANQAVTSAKIANAAVTNTQLASNSVATANIQSQAVTTPTIADANVTGAKLASNTAGVGLLQNTTSKALDVQVDNSSIDINGSNQVEIKALGVSTAKIAAQAVDSTKILFSTTGNGVNASLEPVIDTANNFTTKTVEGALAQLAAGGYQETFTSGEAIGQGDLVVLRRDASNTLKLYKASAAGSDNYISATAVIQAITYTAVTPAGNYISVTYINPGVASAALSVSVTGNAISVSLATDNTGAISSTASQIATAVSSNTSASALVTAVVTGTGSAIQTAQAQTFLSGGVDYTDNGRWFVEGAALDAAAGAGSLVRVLKVGALTCNFVTAPTNGDIGRDVYLSINQGKAVIYTAPTGTNNGIVHIGRVRSTTQIDFKCAILRGVNG